MAELKEETKPKKLLKLFRSLVSEKQNKVSLMRRIRKLMKPTETDLLVRFQNTEETYLSNIYDNTCLNKTSHFSITSLSDIINPYEPWFSLEVKKKPDVDKEALRDWAAKASDAFLTFINNSDYYKYLIVDKRNYDLYGFSAMTITPGTRKLMRIYAENPFTTYIFKDDEGVLGVFWVRTYSALSMETLFKYKPKDGDVQPSDMFDVLCACVPNEEQFVGKVTGEGKYAQIYILKNKRDKDEAYDSDDYAKKDDIESGGGVEIGERVYYSDLVSCVVCDTYENYNPYGEGWGKKLLTTAMNMNQIRRNMLRTAEYQGNPAFTAPEEFYARWRSLRPGRMYAAPYNVQGPGIEPININANLNDQAAFLGMEKEQVNDTVPSFNLPAKKQRQSQQEIQKLLQEAVKNNFIYKIIYLTDGVTEHLKKMFHIAVKKKLIDDPPEGLTLKDVEPSLSSLIVKEFKKMKARGHVEVLTLLQGYFTMYPEALDNFNIDDITRSTNMAIVSGDGLLPWKDVLEIRQVRKQQMEQQQQQQQQLQQAEVEKTRSEAFKNQSVGQQAGLPAVQESGGIE